MLQLNPERIAYKSAEGALLTLRVRLLKRWCFKGPTWGWPFTGLGALGRREAGGRAVHAVSGVFQRTAATRPVHLGVR